MKKENSLKNELKQTAKQAKGAFKTEYERKKIAARFLAYLKISNIQIRDVDQIKAKYIEGYIQHRLIQGKCKRTLQNEMSALRQILRTAGRDKLAESARISNQNLGLAGASRQGNKLAISQSDYNKIHQKALDKQAGFAAAIELARTFGLRGEEAVQSCQSLNTWLTTLEQGTDTIKIIFGTKGGRPRDVFIIDRVHAISVIRNALTICEQQRGRLLDKPNLKQAMTYWRNHCRTIGLIGQYSPHSLRYAFSQDMIRFYQTKGLSKREALALTAMNLGHGDGRGRYVERVYGNKGEA